jgi:hypothetical protein
MPTATLGNISNTATYNPSHYAPQPINRSLNTQHINSSDFSSAAAAAAVCHLANLTTTYTAPATAATTQSNFTIQSTNIFNNFVPNGSTNADNHYSHPQTHYKPFVSSSANANTSLRYTDHSNNTNIYSTSQINNTVSSNDLFWNRFHQAANTPLSNQTGSQYMDGLQFNILRNLQDTRTQYTVYNNTDNSAGATTSPSSLSSNGSSPLYNNNSLVPSAATNIKYNSSPKFAQQTVAYGFPHDTSKSSLLSERCLDSPSNGTF